MCDRVIKELHRQDVPNVFLKSSVTSHSQQQLADMLSVIIKNPLDSSQVCGGFMYFLCCYCHYWMCGSSIDMIDDVISMIIIVIQVIQSITCIICFLELHRNNSIKITDRE